MEIVISNSSDKPIYEQIAAQIREQVLTGVLTEGEQLPSIRSLATQLRISAITTKRAYQDLEAQREERLRMVESSLVRAVSDARAAGISADELREMLDLLLEEDEQR